MARIKIEFELDDLLSDGKLSADDMVECLTNDAIWAADNLSPASVEKLRHLIGVIDA